MLMKKPQRTRTRGMRKAGDAGEAQSLAAFMLQKVRDACLVCQLPPVIRDQLGPAAGKRGFTRQDQVAWLREACGVKEVTLDILNAHFNGRHDREEGP